MRAVESSDGIMASASPIRAFVPLMGASTPSMPLATPGGAAATSAACVAGEALNTADGHLGRRRQRGAAAHADGAGGTREHVMSGSTVLLRSASQIEVGWGCGTGSEGSELDDSGCCAATEARFDMHDPIETWHSDALVASAAVKASSRAHGLRCSGCARMNDWPLFDRAHVGKQDELLDLQQKPAKPAHLAAALAACTLSHPACFVLAGTLP